MQKIITKLLKKKQFAIKSEGNSMLPLLQHGDLVYYRPIKFSKCLVNDLIIVQKNKQLFTHRIIYKNKKYLTAKGDNNLTSDGRIYPNQIIGKVYQVKRNGQIIDPENIYLFQSTLYFQEIIKIKKAFERAKIDFVFLKGLPLHLHFEKTYPRRIYLDCDVLANRRYSQEIEQIMINLGYKQTDGLLNNQIKRNKGEGIEVTFVKSINNFPVIFDIHFEVDITIVHLNRLETLYPQKLINELTRECLRTKRKITINRERFLILNSEFLILYLALHFFHHNFRGAFRLEFLDNVIKKTYNVGNGLDRSLQIIIEKYRLQNFVYPSFLLLNRYYNTPTSSIFLKAIKSGEARSRFARQYLNINIFDDESRVKAGINRFKNLFLLSPNNIFTKLLVFLNPQVIYAIFWTINKKLKYLVIIASIL